MKKFVAVLTVIAVFAALSPSFAVEIGSEEQIAKMKKFAGYLARVYSSVYPTFGILGGFVLVGSIGIYVWAKIASSPSGGNGAGKNR